MKLLGIEKRWLQATFDGFAPPTESDEPGLLGVRDGEVDHVKAFESLNARGTVLAKAGLHFAVAMAGLAPLWSGQRFASIDQLSIAERVRLLDAMSEHRLTLVKELTWLLKVQASMSLLGNEEVRGRSAYDRNRDSGTPVRLRRKGEKREVA